MNPFDDGVSGGHRRSPTRGSAGLPQGGGDDGDDDDYDLDAFAVSDGFRPGAQPGPPFEPPLPPSAVLQPAPPATGKVARDADRPSSTSKPPRTAHDSLTLRNDGSSTGRRLQPDGSSLAASPLMQAETPYTGPSGPSHPYDMYPQRTFSSATTSTDSAASRQSYDGPRGPTHPYTLYTQSTATSEEASQTHIPVGFTGLGGAYQRQIGPDGEEAGDLIGPLGHLEELPPYTRYPEESYVRKSPEPVPVPFPGSPPPASSPPASSPPASSPPASSPQASSSSAQDPPVQPPPGAGGLGIATRDPEFSSTEDDLALSRSRPTSRTETDSHHEVNTAARDMSEKPMLTKWQRRARKKLWGIIPYWAICLLLASIVIMGIVIGAVIGTVLANHDGGSSGGDEELDTKPTGTPNDIIPLSTLPAGLPPMPTGFFALPPLDTSQAPKACFKDPTQAQAWSCDMPFRFYSLDIRHLARGTETCNYQLTMTALNSSSDKFAWGTQLPNLPDPRNLQLVIDKVEKVRGAAWWIDMIYNKTVIVSEESFANAKGKREWPYSPTKSMAGIDPSTFKRKSVAAKDGDKPWICTWPNTSLEIFIYPNQSVSSSRDNTKTTSTLSSPNAYPTGDQQQAPMADFPNVVKFLERRYDDASATASCRQVQIVDNASGSRDVCDSDGNPIVVPISESLKALEGPGQTMRFGQPDGPSSLSTREVLQMTDCGCQWWST